jgi:MGT family glycosyltransferase
MTGQKHIAFFNIPALGHVYPTLPVVAELVRRGHRVSYAAVPDRDALITKTGAQLVPYGSTRPGDADPTYAAPAGAEYIAGTLLSFLIEAERTLPQLEAAFAADRPDLIVFDRMAFAGSVFARKHGLPAVQLWPMMVSGPQWSWVRPEDLAHPTMDGYLAYLDVFLAAEGLQIDPASFLAPQVRRHLAFYPRAFQCHGELFDDSYCFVGPCVGERTDHQRWTPPANGSDVVLITMGTQGNLLPDFYRGCFEAFADSRWHVVLVVGKRFDPAGLGAAPANFEVLAEAPQVDILRQAKVLVSHGGMGGVMEAVEAGVPHVAFPGTREQETNAARLAELGLGVVLSDPSALRSAVDYVCADAAMRSRIAAMQAEITAAGGTRRAADVIEECLASRSSVDESTART